MSDLDFSRCRDVWVPDDSDAGGFWSPPPPHVKVGVEWLLAHLYGLLGDDMGGMKTAQSIIAAQFLSEQDKIDRVIVVAPASVRPKVWYDEDLGQLKEQLWLGKRNKISEYHSKIRSWTHEPDGTNELRWICTNYEFIRNKHNLATLFAYCGPKTLLIFDESSLVRGHDSGQTESAMLLRWKAGRRGKAKLGAERCGRVWLLNGTPVAESPMDMFSQGNLMHPSILDCRYITHYRARYAVMVPAKASFGKPLFSPYPKKELQPDGTVKMVPVPIMEQLKGADGWQNLDDLQRRFAPYILRREAKDLGIDFALPSVALTVTLSKDEWQHYREMRDQMVVWLKSGAVATSKTVAIKTLRLAQITSGFLGGIEDANIDEDFDTVFEGLSSDDHDHAPVSDRAPRVSTICEIGRSKLDFALEWHEEQLRRDRDLKLVAWCRFVPELRRYMREVRALTPVVGAACGAKVFDDPDVSQKKEREQALRLLHPKTAPDGAVTVGATQGTGALGLNFTSCHTVLEISYDYSSFKKKQGDSRFNRPGQRQMVSFHYLIAVGPRGQKTIDHIIMMDRLGKMRVNEFTTAAWATKLMEE